MSQPVNNEDEIEQVVQEEFRQLVEDLDRAPERRFLISVNGERREVDERRTYGRGHRLRRY